MGDQITLGQYLPGDSFVHRLDPRVKIIGVLVFMIAAFLIESFLGYGIFFGLVFLTAFVAEVPMERLYQGLKPIFFILLFTFVLNLFLTPGRVLWKFGFLEITEEGIDRAAFIALRLLLLVMGTSLLTLTTSPLELTDGIASLLSPLQKIGFPAQVVAMMISIALRFIPTLFEEAQKIMKAQKARGADFESGNIIARAKAMIPLFVPLFLNAIKRADELGVAMEARCYSGDNCRTRLNPIRMNQTDVIVMAGVILVFTGLCFFL